MRLLEHEIGDLALPADPTPPTGNADREDELTSALRRAAANGPEVADADLHDRLESLRYAAGRSGQEQCD